VSSFSIECNMVEMVPCSTRLIVHVTSVTSLSFSPTPTEEIVHVRTWIEYRFVYREIESVYCVYSCEKVRGEERVQKEI